MLRHHIPTQVATPRCWPVRMPGLEPLSASRFVQPLLLTVVRRTPTLTWHAQFLLPATRKFKLFLQLYYCMLGFARSRDESAQDNSSSKQQARPFQPTHHPLESLRKCMAREDGENREMDGDLTERGGRERQGSLSISNPPHPLSHSRTHAIVTPGRQKNGDISSCSTLRPPMHSKLSRFRLQRPSLPSLFVCSAPRLSPHGQRKGQCFSPPAFQRPRPRAGHGSDGATVVVIRHHHGHRRWILSPHSSAVACAFCQLLIQLTRCAYRR
ncbi:hypothetical protein CTAM01_09759 [Colletotrichum tamarilloi]|uniref:Uncharacterized protein n=1 Tax=Colletotrichum tamarilloi TaxID=1209934 RepID=A0ABQ9R2N2_9PEZI|nr:uncharacterized protein CTAM01_09759 [Colletotrichum tamarilloi]KAK1492808.1 hypothetical protein CTAM01_09759 [Colletotrichum tamarilloi]